jgi:XapX domain-containing protein
MKVLFLSFVVGIGVGVLYGILRVKSPAPPIVALLGLLGMVLGEQLGSWVQTKKLDVRRAASVCLVGERYDRKLHTPPPRERRYADNFSFAGYIAMTEELHTRHVHSGKSLI